MVLGQPDSVQSQLLGHIDVGEGLLEGVRLALTLLNVEPHEGAEFHRPIPCSARRTRRFGPFTVGRYYCAKATLSIATGQGDPPPIRLASPSLVSDPPGELVTALSIDWQRPLHALTGHNAVSIVEVGEGGTDWARVRVETRDICEEGDLPWLIPTCRR